MVGIGLKLIKVIETMLNFWWTGASSLKGLKLGRLAGVFYKVSLKLF